jgi:hypothetical protein
MADTSFTSKGLNTALAALDAPTNLIGSVLSGVSGTSGAYSYIVTAFNGGESIGSSGLSYTNTANTGVRIDFSAVAGATDYRLYRSGAGYTGYLLVANSQSGQPFLRDTFSTTVSGYQGWYLGADTSAKESRALGSRATKFYQVTNGRTLFKEAVLSNGHDAAVNFDLYVVPSGESPVHGNRLFNGVSLDVAETKILSLNTVLEQGDAVYAKASEIGYIPGYGVVSLKISGIEISDT